MEPLNSAAPKSKAQLVPVVVTDPGAIEPPSAWMRYGTSPTEMILAIAIVIVSIAGMIGSIALLLQVLVPVMRSNSKR